MIQSGPCNGAVALEHRYATASDFTGNRKALLERIPQGATVLDVGCWSGSAGRFLKLHRGAVVDGVEPEREMAERAAEEYRKVFCAAVEDILDELIDAGPGAYDAILLLDVLEHLPDPAPVLAAARALVRPGGVALISVPNVAHWRVRMALLAGRWRYRDNGILDRTHLRFFTQESAREFVRSAGWQPTWEQCSVQGFPLFGREQDRFWERWPRLFAVQLLFEAVGDAAGDEHRLA